MKILRRRKVMTKHVMDAIKFLHYISYSAAVIAVGYLYFIGEMV